MTRSRYAWLVAFGALAVLASPIETRADEAPASGTAGMVIYRDPHTGQLGGVPPAGMSGLPAAPSVGSAVEVSGTTPGGGVKLERPGGFMSTMSGSRDAAGRVSVHCEPGSAGREE